MSADPGASPHTISVVIPVYQGEHTLEQVVGELLPYCSARTSPHGHRYLVEEILLVHDHGPDRSAQVIRELAEHHPQVRPVWLSRNYGQHAATLAGMSSAGSDWIVTMDEDGQHDPTGIAAMLDTALAENAQVVYAAPSNPAPHGPLRNLSSRGAKAVTSRLTTTTIDARMFHSYRLILGEIGRSVAAYAGAGVYLDVALGWVTNRATSCPIAVRQEGERPSGYNWRRLFSHFWRLVLSSGTRGLRLVALAGAGLGVLGLLLAIYIIIARLADNSVQPGWASVIVAVLVCSGTVLIALGVVAEYLGMAVNMAMGRPLYLIVSDERTGPLGRDASPPGQDPTAVQAPPPVVEPDPASARPGPPPESEPAPSRPDEPRLDPAPSSPDGPDHGPAQSSSSPRPSSSTGPPSSTRPPASGAGGSVAAPTG
ncbi:MAG: glycosyltransferase [Actinomycetales bacterium]